MRCVLSSYLASTSFLFRSGNELVIDRQLLKLAGLLSGESYNALATELGIPYAKHSNIKKKNQLDFAESFLEILHIWKDKTEGKISELDRALRGAECGGLVNQYK